MSLALYRRYRPDTFAEVIGQEQVTEPLQQAIRNNRVHHAYLFSGPRGCGKTTSARILARSLNCEQGPTPQPCGECQSCQDLARGGPGSLDVIEIDAASHGGVDDARDLRERAFFGPAASRYKIYIVDEAHMVSTQGFNALLKLVEEPPEHVKFIFATTEPEKVIGTIRSRTHHYPFRLVPPATLRAYLEELCEREGVTVEPAVLPLVVRAGGGSVRDSLSVLDQLLSGAGQDGVTASMASALLGYTDAALIDSVVDAFAARDGAAVFELVDRVIESGLDPRRFCMDLLDRLRDLLLVDAVPDAIDKRLVVGAPEELSALAGQAARFGTADLVRAAEILNAGLVEMRGATAPRLQLEILCARILLPGVHDDEAGLASRLTRLERRLSVADRATAGPSTPDETATPAPAKAPEQQRAARAPVGEPVPAERTAAAEPPSTVATPVPDQSTAAAEPPERTPVNAAATAAAPGGGLDVVELRRLWPAVLDAVRSRRKVTWLLLADKVVVTAVTNGRVVLGFPEGGSLRGFASGGHDTVVREAIADVVGVDVQIEAVLAPGGSAAGASRGPASRGKSDGSGEAGDGPQSRGATPTAGPTSPAVVAGAPETPEGVDPEHDPVVADANVSATELLSRELGAVVVEQVDDA